MTDTTTCPCNSEVSYSTCCEPFHIGSKLPPTALQLMRSRYSAYAIGLVDYLVRTTHPDKIKASLKKDIQQTLHNIIWTKLIILKTSSGSENDKAGKVSFEASYLEQSESFKMTEHSRFKKRAGKWYYFDEKG